MSSWLPADVAADYDQLKEVILQYYDRSDVYREKCSKSKLMNHLCHSHIQQLL